jgi:RNA-directed DNA polymerase
MIAESLAEQHGYINRGSENLRIMDYLRQVLTYRNLQRAIEQVKRNKGRCGIDGMGVNQLDDYFKFHWNEIKQSIGDGTYQPSKVLGVEIDKPNGGKRLLGIPTVIDRVIQQMIHQVLSPVYDVEFTSYSYGFRPGKNAHQAIHQALDYINSGFQDIIDLDLKNFFDVVNHDYLMSILYRRIKDERLLRLIRKYLKSGIMLDGLEQARKEGTPQGSPLSPLLSNILLNELDKELNKRGLRYIRYADDCSIFVSSKCSARRVLKGITKFIEADLKLKVNRQKTKICRPINFCILGYNFVSSYEKGAKGNYRLRVCPKTFARMKAKVREITRKTNPMSFSERIDRLNQYMKGWVNYFKYAHMQGKLGDVDWWIRNRLRYCIWHHWKKPEKKRRSLIRLGVRPDVAYAWSRSRMGGWRIACSPILGTTVTCERLKMRGYIPFNEYHHRISFV